MQAGVYIMGGWGGALPRLHDFTTQSTVTIELTINIDGRSPMNLAKDEETLIGKIVMHILVIEIITNPVKYTNVKESLEGALATPRFDSVGI